MKAYEKLIRDVPDFPKPGIIFKDITPLLADGNALAEVIRDMAEPFVEAGVDKVVGIESRGFIFGPSIARALGCGFLLARKPGKLPYKKLAQSYALEYGTDTIEMHEDSVSKGENVLIVDDLIATGGTAMATAQLIEKMGGNVAGYSFLIELAFLKGREKLGNVPIHAPLVY